jgi:hypothetical protein
MKRDILYLPVEQVAMAVVPSKEHHLWQVYLINRNKHSLETILVTSKGYHEDQKTSLLRHAIPHLEAGSLALIESISPEVFHFTNEFWISFYIGTQIYDKKYIYLPSSINASNLSYIEQLKLKGVLHL